MNKYSRANGDPKNLELCVLIACHTGGIGQDLADWKGWRTTRCLPMKLATFLVKELALKKNPLA